MAGTKKSPERAATDGLNVDLWAYIKPESSRRLVISALHEFANRGFHAATTRGIAEGAKMSPSAVYVHYKSKGELLYEISRTGHEAALTEIRIAMSVAPDNPVARIAAYVAAHASWHAEHHVLAHVINYDLRALPRRRYRQIAAVRKRFEDLLREELEAGVAAGMCDVPDVDGTTLAIVSLCIDLSRWFKPSPTHTPSAVGELYADLVVRMIHGERALSAVGQGSGADGRSEVTADVAGKG
jgi:AcrR family transcriptional regulator